MKRKSGLAILGMLVLLVAVMFSVDGLMLFDGNELNISRTETKINLQQAVVSTSGAVQEVWSDYSDNCRPRTFLNATINQDFVETSTNDFVVSMNRAVYVGHQTDLQTLFRGDSQLIAGFI